MAKFAVILAAAGKSSRFKDKNYKKPFAPLANRAVWLHSAEKFLRPRRRQAAHCCSWPRRTASISISSSRRTSPSWASTWSRGAGAGRFDRAGIGPREAGHRISWPFTTPPGLAWPTSGSATCSKPLTRATPRSWRFRCGHAEARRRRPHDRRNRLPRRPVGSSDAASFPPPTAPRGLRQAAATSRPPTMPSSSSGSATQ